MVARLAVIYGKHKEIIKYLIVGVLTTIVSLGVYYGCVLTILDPHDPVELQCANILSWISAVTFAYVANRIFVFNSQNKAIGKEMVSFYLSRVSTLVIDMVIMFVTVSLLSMNDKLAKILVQVIVTIANYLLSKFFVFEKGNG